MTLDPRIVHALEQLTGLTREVAKNVAAYKRQLIEEGMTETEAWVLAQKYETQLMGSAFEDTAEFVKDIEEGEE